MSDPELPYLRNDIAGAGFLPEHKADMKVGNLISSGFS
jgi:hypothetical protein